MMVSGASNSCWSLYLNDYNQIAYCNTIKDISTRWLSEWTRWWTLFPKSILSSLVIRWTLSGSCSRTVVVCDSTQILVCDSKGITTFSLRGDCELPTPEKPKESKATCRPEHYIRMQRWIFNKTLIKSIISVVIDKRERCGWCLVASFSMPLKTSSILGVISFANSSWKRADTCIFQIPDKYTLIVWWESPSLASLPTNMWRVSSGSGFAIELQNERKLWAVK